MESVLFFQQVLLFLNPPRYQLVSFEFNSHFSLIVYSYRGDDHIFDHVLLDIQLSSQRSYDCTGVEIALLGYNFIECHSHLDTDKKVIRDSWFGRLSCILVNNCCHNAVFTSITFRSVLAWFSISSWLTYHALNKWMDQRIDERMKEWTNGYMYRVCVCVCVCVCACVRACVRGMCVWSVCVQIIQSSRALSYLLQYRHLSCLWVLVDHSGPQCHAHPVIPPGLAILLDLAIRCHPVLLQLKKWRSHSNKRKSPFLVTIAPVLGATLLKHDFWPRDME